MTVAELLFVGGVLAAGTIIVTLLVTLTTTYRLWPPGDDHWKALLHWGLVGSFDICTLIVAVLDWNTWMLPRPSSFVIGLVLSVAGGGIFVYSSRVMSRDETTGQVTTELYTDGPYAYSRNPQYVGMLIGLFGFVLLANAVHVVVLIGLHAVWLILLPFAEEPWLRDQFGDEYERYCDHVPRFIGLATIRRLYNQLSVTSL
ncbi:MAG: isoprenylcysteine carboxylmethyltransferase family protein [Halodesulfurarchaeum sp.]